VTSTAFTELVGCEVPLQSAPMGAVSGPELVEAVTSAGAMAMTSFPMHSAPAAAAALEAILERARGPVGVNLLVPGLEFEVLYEMARRAVLVDLYHGPVDAELVGLVKRSGALAGWQVCSLDQAQAAEAAGCDVIVVRGTEGGGRMHGSRPLRPMLDEVLAAVRIPVVAAGGVGTRDDVVALLDAGAAAVRVGTRLLATRESGAHPAYKAAVIAAGPDSTTLTDAYHVFWPDEQRSARVLTSCLDAAAALPDEPVATMPTPNGAFAIPRFAPMPPTRGIEGNVEAMPLYAGVGVHHVHGEEPAADVIRSLAP
jgi:nitronate monooxygenase